MFIILHTPLLFPWLILEKFPRLPLLLMAMASVVIKTRGTTINEKVISSKGAEIITLINISIDMPTGVCLQELFMVILFFHGTVFNVHLLLVLTVFLQAIIPLKGS